MKDHRSDPFLVGFDIAAPAEGARADYAFSIPAVARTARVELHPHVTFFVGENGSGKSTLIEAIAVAAGFSPEGGSRDLRFSTRTNTCSLLHEHIRIDRGRNLRKPRDGYFLRAESFFNVATALEDPLVGFPLSSYGGRRLHDQSHGESFLALVAHRFRGQGIYILDEPEAALSPTRQLVLLALIRDLIKAGSQLIVATHSPILLGYPEAKILQLSNNGIHPIAWEDTEHVRVTREFLTNRDAALDVAFARHDGLL